METDWDDDWENTEIPDLQESTKNRERELKILEERKVMEEADLALAEDLFLEKNKNKNNDSLALLEPVKLLQKKETKEDKTEKERRKKELQEKQRQQTQKEKEKKIREKRHKELYGEAEQDEYDEKYGYIEDKYL